MLGCLELMLRALILIISWPSIRFLPVVLVRMRIFTILMLMLRRVMWRIMGRWRRVVMTCLLFGRPRMILFRIWRCLVIGVFLRVVVLWRLISVRMLAFGRICVLLGYWARR